MSFLTNYEFNVGFFKFLRLAEESVPLREADVYEFYMIAKCSWPFQGTPPCDNLLCKCVLRPNGIAETEIQLPVVTYHLNEMLPPPWEKEDASVEESTSSTNDFLSTITGVNIKLSDLPLICGCGPRCCVKVAMSGTSPFFFFVRDVLRKILPVASPVDFAMISGEPNRFVLTIDQGHIDGLIRVLCADENGGKFTAELHQLRSVLWQGISVGREKPYSDNLKKDVWTSLSDDDVTKIVKKCRILIRTETYRLEDYHFSPFYIGKFSYKDVEDHLMLRITFNSNRQYVEDVLQIWDDHESEFSHNGWHVLNSEKTLADSLTMNVTPAHLSILTRELRSRHGSKYKKEIDGLASLCEHLVPKLVREKIDEVKDRLVKTDPSPGLIEDRIFELTKEIFKKATIYFETKELSTLKILLNEKVNQCNWMWNFKENGTLVDSESFKNLLLDLAALATTICMKREEE